MLEKVKSMLTHASKETIKEEIKAHHSEIISAVTLVTLVYLCIKVNGKPVNVTVNVNGGASFI